MKEIQKMFLEQELAAIEDRLGDPDLSEDERSHWEAAHNDVQNDLYELEQQA